ncbi:hypothetical protein BJ742DRAFT_894222 [Cladochytrium replicatum]|nr:hypothetical protein BJ742DRAFT_894222 [Cladochytrium replicatum]
MDATSSVIGSGIFFLLTATVCFWEEVERITNRFLFFSLVLFLGLFLVTEVAYLSSIYLRGVGLIEVASWSKALCGLTWTLAWASMTFHSAMRTGLIVLPPTLKIPLWAICLIVVGVQVALAGSSAYYFAKSVMDSDGEGIIDWMIRGTIMLLVDSVWNSTVESVIFFAAQIVSVSLELQKASNAGVLSDKGQLSVATSTKGPKHKEPVKPPREVFWVYLNGVLRSACYSANTVLTFTAIGGFFPPYTGADDDFMLSLCPDPFFPLAMAFSAYGPSVAFVLIMTDAKRFNQALELSKTAEHLQHDAVAAT